MKFNLKNIFWISLILLIITINFLAYNHAYNFTHFSESEGLRQKPEALSFTQKVEILILGNPNPKPQNTKKPSLPYQTIYLQSHEKLESWLIEADSSKGVVILFHGYSGNKSSLITYSEAFNALGYSTLLVDFMGCGGSEGNQTTIGFKESKDVKAAFDFIKKTYPSQEIILFGHSMGAVSIMKSIHDFELKPDKIIIQAPFGTMKKTVKRRFQAMGVSAFPLAELLLFYGGLQNGFNAFEHNPTEYATSIQIPTLLMLGKKDNRVTIQEVEAIFKNLQGQKKLEILEFSGHENYLEHSKKKWLEEVKIFFSN